MFREGAGAARWLGRPCCVLLCLTAEDAFVVVPEPRQFPAGLIEHVHHLLDDAQGCRIADLLVEYLAVDDLCQGTDGHLGEPVLSRQVLDGCLNEIIELLLLVGVLAQFTNAGTVLVWATCAYIVPRWPDRHAQDAAGRPL